SLLAQEPQQLGRARLHRHLDLQAAGGMAVGMIVERIELEGRAEEFLDQAVAVRARPANQRMAEGHRKLYAHQRRRGLVGLEVDRFGVDQQAVHIENDGIYRFFEHGFVLSSGPRLAKWEIRRMRIHNLYVDDKGETHFRDIEVHWKNEGPGGKTSDTFKATGVIFRATPRSYDYSC